MDTIPEFEIVFFLLEQKRKKIDIDLEDLCRLPINKQHKKIIHPTKIWNKIFKRSMSLEGEVLDGRFKIS